MNTLNEMFLLAPYEGTLAHLIHTSAQQHNKATWYKRTFGRVNYATADAFSNDIAAFLISAGCKPGYNCYIPNQQTFEQGIALFGAIKAGMVVIERSATGIHYNELLSVYNPPPVIFQNNQFMIGHTATPFKKALAHGAGTLFFIPHICKDDSSLNQLSFKSDGVVQKEVLNNQEAVDLIQSPDSKNRLTPAMRLIDRWCAGEVGFG